MLADTHLDFSIADARLQIYLWFEGRIYSPPANGEEKIVQLTFAFTKKPCIPPNNCPYKLYLIHDRPHRRCPIDVLDDVG